MKYNLDENYIKDIFVNLLTSEMNKDTQKKVLPSYIEIVKQLSQDDAKQLKFLYDLYKTKQAKRFPLVILRGKFVDNPKVYLDIDNVIIASASSNNGISSLHTIKLNQLIADNLSRLLLIKVIDDKWLKYGNYYEIGFNSLKHEYKFDEKIEMYYDKGLIEITEYGLGFLEVCFE